jgi:hypothetical protein
MRSPTRIKPTGLAGVLVVVIALLLVMVAPAQAAPVWEIKANANPTALPDDPATPADPEAEDEIENPLMFSVIVRNIGDEWAPPSVGGNSENCVSGAPPPADPSKCYTITITFPEGLTPLEVSLPDCSITASKATCFFPGNEEVGSVRPFQDQIRFKAVVKVSSDFIGKTLTSSLAISGAGAVNDGTVVTTRVVDEEPEFGVAAFDGLATASPGGEAFAQAGGHPFDLTNSLAFYSYENVKKYFLFPFPGNAEALTTVEPLRDVVVDLPPGQLADLTAVSQCTMVELGNSISGAPAPLCPPGSQVGVVDVRVSGHGFLTDIPSNLPTIPLYNMTPAVGSPARFGFNVGGTMVILDAKIRSTSDYGVSIVSHHISQGLLAQGTDVTFWGVPADEAHRSQRQCPGVGFERNETCAAGVSPKGFLRMPTACTNPDEGLEWKVASDSWFDPGSLDANGDPNLSDPAWSHSSFTTHDPPAYPVAPEDRGPERGIEGCDEVPVKGTLEAKPTSIDTETSSGLSVHVEVPNPGLENAESVTSTSDIKKVVVALPEGMTINPSQADGLGTCSPAQYQSTELSFFPTPGKGCPDDAKIGSVSVKTPLLNETIPGDVYVAKPFDNPFGSLLALYVVLHEPERGVLVKLAGKVDTNERTGQITTTFDNIPQQPFSSFDFKFREGARAPLATPQSCGTYTTTAQFTGWSDPDHPITSTSDFQITRGIGGSPCPSGGLPPFKPGLVAGSINNAAGKYSPFNVRLFRTDAEQEFTRFSIKLPPGISGKLAGVPFCPDAAIEASKARSGEQELASPSCPKASEIGHSLAGAGVGSALVYAPGKIYLAGPYNGSALSIAAITAAKVGPFDLGTVVVRQALKVDPETAEVFIDATGSDPIPHIIDGVTVHLRDIRAYVDKPEFTLNPTNCTRTSTASTLLGSGLDFFSDVDDRPVTVSTPYQAADCAALSFKPDLKLQLKGGTKRAGHPALKATLKMKPGMANIARAQVTLPKSEFLDQSHIGTVCTRVQYAKDQCPAKSVYGYARAFTPILDEPLQGPVYLRSSSHKLPDLVAGLKSGKIEIDLAGRIDSVDGQIRSTFETVPDAPVSKFILTMQGGKKGLLENSTNLCAKAHKAIVEFDGQNGKTSDSTPVVKPQCKGKKRKAAKRRNAR